jgi:hypothetical protein
MRICAGPRARTHDLRDALAVSVWVESIAAASALGAAGAVATCAVSFLTGPVGLPGALIFAGIAMVVGAGFGFFVGAVVGLAMALLVVFGHRRLGARVVATLMPLAAMTGSQGLTFAIFHGAPPFAAAMAVLDALLTLPGALWIARRYRDRAEGRRVH